MDAGTAYSASAELQPKGEDASSIVRSSEKVNSLREGISCLVVAQAHRRSSAATRAEEVRKEVHSTCHLHKREIRDLLCIHCWSMSGSMENQPLHGADRIKDTGCRCACYVN